MARPADRTAAGLARSLGMAVVLVLAVAAAFAGIGAFQDDEADPVIAGSVDEGTSGDPTDTDAGTATPDGTSSPDAAPADAGEDVSVDDGDPPGDDGVEPTDDGSTATEPEPPAPSEQPADEASETEDPVADGEFDPANVSVQVLDAHPEDGGVKAGELAERLRADGYNVVAVNKAYRAYEQTTVMYTPGYEAQARQVAQQYGFSVVQEQPGNLSEQVQVHLVVGADA